MGCGAGSANNEVLRITSGAFKVSFLIQPGMSVAIDPNRCIMPRMQIVGIAMLRERGRPSHMDVVMHDMLCGKQAGWIVNRPQKQYPRGHKHAREDQSCITDQRESCTVPRCMRSAMQKPDVASLSGNPDSS